VLKIDSRLQLLEKELAKIDQKMEFMLTHSNSARISIPKVEPVSNSVLFSQHSQPEIRPKPIE
jgi:hypothetical protein